MPNPVGFLAELLDRARTEREAGFVKLVALKGLFGSPVGLSVPDVQPVIAVPGLRAALHSGNPDLRPMFEAFTSSGVRWPGGQQEAVDSVIYATGYHWNGEYLPRAALDDHGGPQQRLGVGTSLPGLYFVGLPGQRSAAPGTVRAAGPDAEYVVARLAAHLERPHV